MSDATRAKYYEEVAKTLTQRLERVALRIDKIILEIGTTRETSSAYWNGVNSRVRVAYDEARSITREWIEAKIPVEYTRALAEAIRTVKSKTVKPQQSVALKKYMNTLHNKQSLKSMLNEIWHSFDTGLRSGQGTLLRLTSLTQQTLVTEARVNKSIERGFLERGTAGGSKVKLRDALMSRAGEGKYITVVNKNGDPMQFKIDSYAEMVARTKLSDAASQAVLNTAQATESDLVQISAHNTLTPLCQEYEGKIFSLSGSDADFPALDATPPFHPNCMHSMSVVQKEALALDGTLSDYVAFSNGETEAHPTRTSFVPVSQRSAK